MRLRLLDLAVATVSVVCVCAPFMLGSSVAATNPSVVESGGTVDQRVKPAGWISNPLDVSFESGGSGTKDGSVSWSQFTTGRKGAKLVLSAVDNPAMSGADDVSSTPAAWPGGNRFGFTALGPIALNRFADGAKWRGFDGKRGVEVARRGAAFGSARTTIKLRAELSGDRGTASIRATAVPNL